MRRSIFYFFINFGIFQNFMFSVKNQKFMIFAEKVEIYVKIILFRPMLKIAIKPMVFIVFLGEFSPKINFSLNFTIFTKNQLFHPKSSFYEKVHFSHFFERPAILFENRPNYLVKTLCQSNISSLGRKWRGKVCFPSISNLQ